MSKGRMIDAVISNSRKVNSVSDQAALLFSWIQPHTDDYGRIEGETQDVLFLIVPRRGWNELQVESYLKELWSAGLLKKYTDENRRYFEVYAFDEHQTFRSDRSRKPKYPLPTEFDTQWDTTDSQRVKIDTEVKLSEVKLSQVKLRPKTPVGIPTETHEKIEQKIITPKDKAKKFFEGVRELENKQDVPWLKDMLTAIAEGNKNMQKGVIWNEIRAFTDYWTELTHTGIKQRWECQKTFEVEKRLRTWFSRAGFKGFTTANGKSSRAKDIIGLDDDKNE